MIEILYAAILYIFDFLQMSFIRVVVIFVHEH